MKNETLIFAFLLALALPAHAERYKDTAGTFLKAVIQAVRQEYPDAELVGISGRTDVTNSALCEKDRPADDGWYYHFFSKAAENTYLLITECQGYVVGPMKEMVEPWQKRNVQAIGGKFIDNDEALRSLAEAGVAVDPVSAGLSGKRPYSFSLLHVEDDRFKDNPIFWQVRLGNSAYMVNAGTRKVERDVKIRYETAEGAGAGDGPSSGAGYGASEGGAAAISRGGPPRARPRKGKGYTALTDLEKVKDFARQKLPGGVLMGIDGLVDSWGHCECFGPGDGWAYYYYSPQTRSIETVFACKGELTLTQSTYIPVSLTLHKGLPSGTSTFIDSDKALDGLLTDRDSVMNEGMGRYYSRRVPLRLMQYRSSPFSTPELWSATFMWQAEIGQTMYYIDARTGKFLSERRGD